MTRVPVVSSQIQSIGYSGGVLEVEFRTGAVYRYLKVPIEIFAKLLDAPSTGKAFQTLVRGTTYPYEKLIAGECPACGAAGYVGDTCEDCGCATVTVPTNGTGQTMPTAGAGDE